MPVGIPRTEEERRERHARLYGGEPPAQRLGLGPKGEDVREFIHEILPANPNEFGKFTLPIPRGLARRLYGGRRRI